MEAEAPSIWKRGVYFHYNSTPRIPAFQCPPLAIATASRPETR